MRPLFPQSDSPRPPLALDADHLTRLKHELHERLVRAIDVSAMATLDAEGLRREVRRAAEELCEQTPDLLTRTERERLVNEVLDEAFGLGPLEPLLRDPTVSDILINGPHLVFVERQGRLEEVAAGFRDERHLQEVVRRLVSRVGRRVDESRPLVDARLPDGSRINAVIPPIGLDGTAVSIRRFGTRPLHLDDLVHNGAIAPEMVEFLSACIRARLNLVISGGTGSGKTTLLNALSARIATTERIVTIEDAAELRLQQRHVVRLETRPANVEGHGEITTRDLVRNALRMRPDRIIVGESRGPEALDMLQAMNTGHDGSMTTLHANDTREALGRLEMMAGMAGLDLPLWILRRQIASAVQLVVQVARLSGGVRRVLKISEVTGMEGELVSMHDLFGFRQTGVNEDGVARGYFYATGIPPRCLERLAAAGVPLDRGLFDRRRLDGPESPPLSPGESEAGMLERWRGALLPPGPAEPEAGVPGRWRREEDEP